MTGSGSERLPRLLARRRKVGKLLALAVLSVVMQRPMYPYEMASIIREREKDRDMAIKWGSLYTVVRNLEKHGLLEATETVRAGGRPERTIYRITDAGREELEDWVRELVSSPEREHLRFEAGLSVLGVLSPDEATDLLRRRLHLLDAQIAEQRESLTRHLREIPLPRVHGSTTMTDVRTGSVTAEAAPPSATAGWATARAWCCCMVACPRRRMHTWLLERLTKTAMAGEERKGTGDHVPMRMLARTLHYDFQLIADASGPPERFGAVSAEVLLLGSSKPGVSQGSARRLGEGPAPRHARGVAQSRSCRVMERRQRGPTRTGGPRTASVSLPPSTSASSRTPVDGDGGGSAARPTTFVSRPIGQGSIPDTT